MTLIHKSFTAKSHRSLGLEMAKWLNGRPIVNSVTNGCKVTLYVEGKILAPNAIVRNSVTLADVMTPELRSFLSRQIRFAGWSIVYCFMKFVAYEDIAQVTDKLREAGVRLTQHNITNRHTLLVCDKFLFEQQLPSLACFELFKEDWLPLTKEKLNALSNE